MKQYEMNRAVAERSNNRPTCLNFLKSSPISPNLNMKQHGQDEHTDMTIVNQLDTNRAGNTAKIKKGVQ